MKSKILAHVQVFKRKFVRSKVRFYSQTLERRRYLGGVF